MPKIHQRVNSSTSIRSATSPRLGDSWSSLESAPRTKRDSKPSLGNGMAATSALQQSLAVGAERAMTSPKQGQRTSPLLFGGSSIWTPSKAHPES